MAHLIWVGGGFWAVVPFGNCVLWVRCFNVVCKQVTISWLRADVLPWDSILIADGYYAFFFTAFLVDYDVGLGANPKGPAGQEEFECADWEYCAVGMSFFNWVVGVTFCPPDRQCVVRFRKSFGGS